MEPSIRVLLEQLSEQLSEVIAESVKLGETLDAVRSAGYSVHLLLDCKPQDKQQLQNKLETDERDEEADIELSASARPLPETGFRIDAHDLAFLRSVGIDPTRRCRGRRGVRS